MTEFKKAQNIRNILCNRTGSVFIYAENWSNDYCVKSTKDTFRKLVENYHPIDPRLFTEREMDQMGFGRWSKEHDFRLIPIWLYPFLPQDIEVISINENKVKGKRNMDTDTRFGCLAYGVYPREQTLSEKFKSWLDN